MTIDITSDYGQIGPLRWINSNTIPQRSFTSHWFIQWGATFRVNGGCIVLQEVPR